MIGIRAVRAARPAVFALAAFAAATFAVQAYAGSNAEASSRKHYSINASKSCNSTFCQLDAYTVPSTKQFEIERVSCNVSVAGETGLTALAVERAIGTTAADAEYLTPADTGTIGYFHFFLSNNELYLLIKPTNIVRIIASSDDPVSNINCRVTGWLTKL